MVWVKGLEPPRLSTLEPKSSASTNSAIPTPLKGAIKKMGRPTGFEPATTRTTTEGSTAELRPPLLYSRDSICTQFTNGKGFGRYFCAKNYNFWNF
jgi:hypothetical protein